uniref:Uncharacterized protein n=1 Tax=Arundo donax TaxID=35708 RepID=A0A0A9ABY1_ARUDO
MDIKTSDSFIARYLCKKRNTIGFPRHQAANVSMIQVFTTMHKLNVICPLFQFWEPINSQMVIITYCRQLKHWIIKKTIDLMIPYLGN